MYLYVYTVFVTGRLAMGAVFRMDKVGLLDVREWETDIRAGLRKAPKKRTRRRIAAIEYVPDMHWFPINKSTADTP